MLCLSRQLESVGRRATQDSIINLRPAIKRCHTKASRGTLLRRSRVHCTAAFPTSTDLVSELHGVAAQMSPGSTPSASSGSKPILSMRPITTHVNVMVTGTHHVGKVPYHKMTEAAPDKAASGKAASGSGVPASPDTAVRQGALRRAALNKAATTLQSETASSALKLESQANDSADKTPASSPHAAFTKDPLAWATTLKPVLLPQACREMVYTIQDTPGQGAALDPFIHMECLLAFVLKQQAKDYKQLAGCRGLHKSLACGCLEHSPTVCIYTLPAEGPSKADLMIMSMLSQHVAVLPVITGPSTADGQGCQELVLTMLENPAAYVAGLAAIELTKFAEGDNNQLTQLPLLLVDQPSKKVSEVLVKLISSDQVYTLLDIAWEKYNTFCKVYEQAGNDLDALLTSDMAKLQKGVAHSISKRHPEVDTINKLQLANKVLRFRGDLYLKYGNYNSGYGYNVRSTDLHYLMQQADVIDLAQLHGFNLPGDEALITKMWPKPLTQ